MKRFFSILLCMTMILGMAGCTGIRATEPAENDAYVIGFSQVGSESDWRVANTKSMTDTFADDDEYELVIENARQQQENQFTAVRRFILEGVDFIIIAPTVEEGWETILTEIQDAGIPVIIVDRSVAVEDDSLYLTTSSVRETLLLNGWKKRSLKILTLRYFIFRERSVRPRRSSVQRLLKMQ